MTPMRWVVLAAMVGLLTFDLARGGSEEYSFTSRIARSDRERAILQQHHEELRIAIQQRLLSRVGASGANGPFAGSELAAPVFERARTPWERANERADAHRAHASAPDGRRVPVDLWLGQD